MQAIDSFIDTLTFGQKITTETRDRLCAGLTCLSVEPGADILHPGDEVDGVYFVRSGAIRVYYIDAAGHEGTLYWIEPGESCILALNSLFTEIPYPAWAAAEESGVEIVTVPGAVFRDLFSREPALQKFLFEQLSERVFSLLRRLEESMRLPQEERLILLLLAQADEDGIIHLSQDKLARHLGTIREVVSRLLRNLVSQGLISLAPRRITVLDRERLEKLVPEAEYPVT
ncbi:Crp/Fnr family transcriptional regulator [Emcibacter nanhaiensis]|uniref:Crp/Fnr family transcriptional regulator n=1 Tax=Emcibacter nanhaiensis TaxID=1505037 RepID=A0A501PGH4_9PROT|nr:Crp/Fnr family transcriptional regulator [Emcibacter nanhaiensis]TPD59295.1 Crp/Fnr family transcriptional regulator [Emcibacter nanhaiensis]